MATATAAKGAPVVDDATPETPTPETAAPPVASAATGILSYDDSDIADIPSGRVRKSTVIMDEFDALVRTAPRDKARKFRCAVGDGKGLANRLARALKRCELREVFTTGYTSDATGEFAYLRPITPKAD